MTPRQRRMSLVAAVVIGVGLAAALMLRALNENIAYFYEPSRVIAGEAPNDKAFRIGGLVTEGSVRRNEGELEVEFDLTDMKETVTVRYAGLLPDLFREGQGIIATGRMDENGVFVAEEVLAKHDENYMPPEVAESLKEFHGDDS